MPMLTTPVYLACGHAATAASIDGNRPFCAICCASAGAEAFLIATPPDLSYRTAVCLMCQSECASSLRLPWFKHTPLFPFDSFYCGCMEADDE